MLEQCTQAYEDWRAADREARDMEARLALAWELYSARHDAPPSLELMQQVSRLREEANDKLTIAMAMIELAQARITMRPGTSSRA